MSVADSTELIFLDVGGTRWAFSMMDSTYIYSNFRAPKISFIDRILKREHNTGSKLCCEQLEASSEVKYQSTM